MKILILDNAKDIENLSFEEIRNVSTIILIDRIFGRFSTIKNRNGEEIKNEPIELLSSFIITGYIPLPAVN